MKISVLTLGCKVNKYESDSLVNELSQKGYAVTEKLETADAYIINTCAVTNEAEKKSRQMIERARKCSPDAKIFVVGCASQNRFDQFDKKNVNFVQGVACKKKILDELENIGTHLYDLPKEYEDDMTALQSTTRAYIKVQDGCDRFCSYCVIPYIRGRSRSRSLQSIEKEVASLPQDIKEIVVVGIDVADFRVDGEKNLALLLERLDKFGKRIRLSSMEDNLITEEFLMRLKVLKNFCPQFHLSLQSGCDAVLKKMNRHYTTSQFFESVQLIRKFFPNAGITTDIIVGFPTETEEDFEQTLKFVEKVSFSQLHIFPYSKRTGTVASKLYKDLSGKIKADRAERLHALGEKLKAKFIAKNKKGKVLVEEINGQVCEGYTENYIKCYFQADAKVGDVVDVKIVRQHKDGAWAEL